MTACPEDGRPALSVIIPAHNAASTLEASVRSVFETAKDFGVEAIIVENGSQDATPAIARALEAERPGGVRALESAVGVSNARNAGMDAARGDWIAFLDADDKADVAALRELAERAAEAKAVVAAGDILRAYSASAEAHRYAAAPRLWQGEQVSDFCGEVLRPQTFMGNVWGKVFERAWLEANGLRFDPSLSLAEDAEFMFRCARRADRVIYRPVQCYEYRLNMASAVRRFSESLPDRYIEAIEAIRGEIGGAGGEKYLRRFDSFALYHLLLIAVNHSFHPQNPRAWRERLRGYRELASAEPFAAALTRVNYRDFSISRAIPLFFTARRFYAGVMLVAGIRHVMFRVK